MSKRMRHKGKVMFGGLSAEEFHTAHAFPIGARCAGCKTTKGLITRLMTLAPIDELRKRDAMFDMLCEKQPMKILEMTVQTIHGPHVRMATIYACRQCTPTAEKQAAKGPSWVIVDINRGPGYDRIVA